MLCACCSSASSLEIRTRCFLQVGYPVDSRTSKPHLVFRHKAYEIALSELATQMGSIKVSSFEMYKFDPFPPHISGNSCMVMFWVACELLQFAATQLATSWDLSPRQHLFGRIQLLKTRERCRARALALELKPELTTMERCEMDG